MIAVIVGLLLMGVVEVSVLVALSEAVSWEFTLLTLILVGALGAWVVQREGTATWRRVMSGVRAGQMPTSSVLDGLLVLLAGVLLLLPGLVSDLMALALAFPPIRSRVRDRLTDHFQRRIAARASRARTTTVFGFGSPGFGFGTGFGAGGPDVAAGRRFDDDVIDLDGEEVDLSNLRAGELPPPQDRTA